MRKDYTYRKAFVWVEHWCPVAQDWLETELAATYKGYWATPGSRDEPPEAEHVEVLMVQVETVDDEGRNPYMVEVQHLHPEARVAGCEPGKHWSLHMAVIEAMSSGEVEVRCLEDWADRIPL